MVHQTRRPPRRSRGSYDAASAAGRSKERVGAMTRVLGMAVFVGGMLAHVPAAAAPVAGVDDGNVVRTVDVAECKTKFTFRGTTVTGCTTLGSPGNVPWCELANPPADRSSPAWAFCRVAGDNSRRPRTGRAAGTAQGRTTTSGRTTSRNGRRRDAGGGGSENPSETDNGREAPFREARDGEDDDDNADDDDEDSFDNDDSGEDGANGSGEGDFEDGEEGQEDDAGNDDGSEDPDAEPNDGGDGGDGDSAGSTNGNPDGSGSGTNGEPIGTIPPPVPGGSDPSATPIPPEVTPVPTGTDPLPTPTGVSPTGLPGAPTDRGTDGNAGGSDAPQNGPTGLSTAAIAGIAVGAAAAALLLIVPFYVNRKKSAEQTDAAAAAASSEEEKEYGNAAPSVRPRPVPLAVDNVRSTFASTYRSTVSSEPRSNRSSVSSRTTSQYGPDPSTITFSEAPLGRWTVATNYVPSLSDELVVEPGDIVDVYKKFDDGWVTAVNVSKGFARGVMPMHCLDMDQGQLSPELIDEEGVEMFQ